MRCTHAERKMFYKKKDDEKYPIKQAVKVDYHFEEEKRGMRVLARRDPDTK